MDWHEALGIDLDDPGFQAAMRRVEERNARSVWYACRWERCSWQYDPVEDEVCGGMGVPLCECDRADASRSDRLHRLLQTS